MLTLEETIERILKNRSDYERKDILKMIEDKRQELGPEVINDESAAMIVARELGVDLHQMTPTAGMKIEDLTESTRSVGLTVRVDHIGNVRSFARKDRDGEGKVASLRVSDDTGNIRVVLWDELTRPVEEDLISIDDIIQLRGGYVKKGLGDSLEVNLGQRGHFRKVEKSEIEELGIDFGASKSEDMKISDLTDGLFGITTKAVIQRVFSLSTFTRQRDNSEGRVLSMIAADDTGTVRLVFWDDNATEMENAEPGEVIRLRNVNTRLNRDGTDVEVHVGRASVIERGLKDKIDAVAVETPRSSSESLGMKNIADLAIGMWDVDIEGKVVTAYDEKEYTTKDGREGRLRALVLVDESAQTRVTFWNDDIEKIADVKEGDVIRILHGYTKEGFRGGIDFQIGRNAEIQINPKGSKLKKLDVSQVSLQPLAASRVMIEDINDSHEGKNVEICGIVVNLTQSMSPIYQACPECNKKLDEVDGGFICKSCGKIDKPPVPRMLYKITVDDGSGSIRITMFGEKGEELLQMTAAEADKIIKKSGKAEQPLIDNSDKVVGRYISVNGRVRKYRDSLDISAYDFDYADPATEVKRLKGEISKELA